MAYCIELKAPSLLKWSDGPCRNIISNLESKQSQEQEERAHLLAQKVAQATFDQIKAQVEADVQKIRATLPSKDSQALQTAKDMKYVKDRQLNLDCLVDFEHQICTNWSVLFFFATHFSF